MSGDWKESQCSKKFTPDIQKKCEEVLAQQYQEFLTACKQQPQLELLIKRKYSLKLSKECHTFYVTMTLHKDVYKSLLYNNPTFGRLLHIEIASGSMAMDNILDSTFRKIINEKLYSSKFDEFTIDT